MSCVLMSFVSIAPIRSSSSLRCHGRCLLIVLFHLWPLNTSNPALSINHHVSLRNQQNETKVLNYALLSSGALSACVCVRVRVCAFPRTLLTEKSTFWMREGLENRPGIVPMKLLPLRSML